MSVLHAALIADPRARPRVDVERILHPRSVAVFGASDSKDKFGGRIMLAEAGVTVNLQTQENVTMLTNGRKGDFQAYFTFWSGRPDPDGNVFTQSTCKGAQNDSHYCNADVDALLTKARQVPDPAERKKLYDQATEIMRSRGRSSV